MAMANRNLRAAQQREVDLRLGIVTDPDAGRLRYSAAYQDCGLGPRCPYPFSCCDTCHRHSPTAHPAGRPDKCATTQ